MAEITPNERELLDALKGMHSAADILLAALVVADRSFLPTKSPTWPALGASANLLKRYGEL